MEILGESHIHYDEAIHGLPQNDKLEVFNNDLHNTVDPYLTAIDDKGDIRVS